MVFYGLFSRALGLAMLDNRVDKLVNLVTILFGQSNLLETSTRFKQGAKDFLAAVEDGEARASQWSFDKTIRRRLPVVQIGGYRAFLITAAKSKRKEAADIESLCSKNSNPLSPCEFEMIMFLVEADRMLSRATQAHKEAEVNEHIKNFFGQIKKAAYFYNGGFNTQEALSYVRLLHKVLRHKVLVLDEHNERDEALKNNFDKFSERVILDTIQCFNHDDQFNPLVSLLEEETKNYFPDLMNRFKVIYEKQAAKHISTPVAAVLHNFGVNRAAGFALRHSDRLTFDSVSWLNTAKLYDESRYNNPFYPSANATMLGLIVISGIFATVQRGLDLQRLKTDESITPEEIEDINTDAIYYRIFMYGLAIFAAYFVVDHYEKCKSIRVLIFPSVAFNLDDKFSLPCQWEVKEPAKINKKITRAENDDEYSDAEEDFYYDAELIDEFHDAEEDYYQDALNESPEIVVQEVILTDEDKIKVLQDAYVRAVNIVKPINEHAKYFFKTLEAKAIRKYYTSDIHTWNFFDGKIFLEKYYCTALLVDWDDMLITLDLPPFVLEAPPKTQSVASPVRFTLNADRLREEIASVLKRCLIPKQLSEDGNVRFAQILYMRYDVLLVCKALRHVETEDVELYKTMVSADSPVKVSDLIKALKKDQIEDQSLFDLCAQLKNHDHSSLNFTYKSKEVQSEDDLERKYEALNALIDRATLHIPAHEKRAFMMAMVEIVRLSKRLGKAEDERLELITPIVSAFDDYKSHKNMFKIYEGELGNLVVAKASKGAKI